MREYGIVPVGQTFFAKEAEGIPQLVHLGSDKSQFCKRCIFSRPEAGKYIPVFGFLGHISESCLFG